MRYSLWYNAPTMLLAGSLEAEANVEIVHYNVGGKERLGSVCDTRGGGGGASCMFV